MNVPQGRTHTDDWVHPILAAMKVKVISRSVEDFTRSTTREVHKIHRNQAPTEHPLEQAREFKRALNAAKLERMFAKPFVAALSRHEDSVSCLTLCPSSLIKFVSGGHDGQIIAWDLAQQKALWNVPKAHVGAVNGIVYTSDGANFLSCGHDKTIKLFQSVTSVSSDDVEHEEAILSAGRYLPVVSPIRSFVGKNSFLDIDRKWGSSGFATSGAQVDIWDLDRSSPVHHFSWGAESIKSLRFNPVETNILASCGSDNTIVLYDVRLASPTQKVVLKLRTNKIAWNPMEAINFTAANEDSNLYTFDMRKLESATCVHRGHMNAVLDVSYSPTGLEFVSASYDRTVRVFENGNSRSRDVYHARRMGHVLSARFTADAKYLLSGSDDHNVRLWKAVASAPIRPVTGGEKRKMDYTTKLKDRYQHVPEVSRILRHRHLPKVLFKTNRRVTEVLESSKRKQANRVKHSKPGTLRMPAERKKHIVKVIE